MEPTVLNDRNFSNNNPDVIIPDNKQGTCMSTDVAIIGTEMWSRKKLRRF